MAKIKRIKLVSSLGLAAAGLIFAADLIMIFAAAGRVSLPYMIIISLLLAAAIGIGIFSFVYLRNMSIQPECPCYDEVLSSIEKISIGSYDDVEEPSDDSDEFESAAMYGLYILAAKLKQNEQLKQDNLEYIKEAISNVSHDLKTPLSSIRGYAEGLLDNIADTEEKKEQYARMIISKVGTITSLLSELSYYSSIDTDGVMDVLLPISVKEYFDDCADEISPELEMKHINFTYINSVEPDVKFCIDVQKVSKALKNIIGNSMKFVEYDEGVIMLKVEEKDSMIEVSIQDNGRGIAADKLPYIFERYYKADTARSSSRSGSGIGLSIVKKIIEDHGGQVYADSKEGLGTIISFTLHKYHGDE